MQEQKKLTVCLSEEKYKFLCAIADSLHKSPEEVAQNVLIGYLAIVDVKAKDETCDPNE